LTSVTPGEAEVELRAGSAIALDVRERSEYESGTVPGALFVPLGRLDPAALDPDRRYITVCASGSRSAVAAGTSEALANAISSSPVFGSSLCASMAGNAGC